MKLHIKSYITQLLEGYMSLKEHLTIFFLFYIAKIVFFLKLILS